MGRKLPRRDTKRRGHKKADKWGPKYKEFRELMKLEKVPEKSDLTYEEWLEKEKKNGE